MTVETPKTRTDSAPRMEPRPSGTKTLKAWIPYIVLFVVIVAWIRLSADNGGPEVLAPAVRNASGFLTLLPEEDIEGFAEYSGRMYAVGSRGLFELDGTSFSPIRHVPISSRLQYAKAILSDEVGSLWMACVNGVLRYWPETGEETWWTARNGLPDNRVNTLFRDSAGRVWAGTWGGAGWFDGNSWHVWTESDGLSSDMVNAIAEDKDGGLWFGAYNVRDGVLSILPDARLCLTRSLAPRNWQYLTLDDGIPHASITALLADEDGAMWVGTGFLNAGGACRVIQREGRWEVSLVFHRSASQAGDLLQIGNRSIPVAGGLVGEKVRSLYRDTSGILWLGSEYDGLTMLSGTGLSGYVCSCLTTETGLGNAEIKKTYEDGKGNIWLATKAGVTVIPFGTTY